MTPKRQRMLFVGASAVSFCAAALLIMAGLRDNVVFFFTPSELASYQGAGKTIRVGGLVKAGSVVREDASHVRFTITDGNASTVVYFSGLLPALFREGQGVVAEGVFKNASTFTATRVLAKHDENYMPPEVARKLKASGHWHGKGDDAARPR